MITLISTYTFEQVLMPTSVCPPATWRDRVMVNGTDAAELRLAHDSKRMRVAVADVFVTTPGSSAWSPPT